MDERLSSYALIARAAINVTVPLLTRLFSEKFAHLQQVLRHPNLLLFCAWGAVWSFRLYIHLANLSPFRIYLYNLLSFYISEHPLAFLSILVIRTNL